VIREQRQGDPVAAREWSGWTLTAVDAAFFNAARRP